MLKNFTLPCRDWLKRKFAVASADAAGEYLKTKIAEFWIVNVLRVPREIMYKINSSLKTMLLLINEVLYAQLHKALHGCMQFARNFQWSHWGRKFSLKKLWTWCGKSSIRWHVMHNNLKYVWYMEGNKIWVGLALSSMEMEMWKRCMNDSIEECHLSYGENFSGGVSTLNKCFVISGEQRVRSSRRNWDKNIPSYSS